MGLHGLFLVEISLTVSTIYVCVIVINLMCMFRAFVGNIIKRRPLLTVLKSLMCLELTFR